LEVTPLHGPVVETSIPNGERLLKFSDFKRVQTLQSKVRFSYASWSELWQRITANDKRIQELERKVFEDAANAVKIWAERLGRGVECISELDVALNCPPKDKSAGWVEPIVNDR